MKPKCNSNRYLQYPVTAAWKLDSIKKHPEKIAKIMSFIYQVVGKCLKQITNQFNLKFSMQKVIIKNRTSLEIKL